MPVHDWTRVGAGTFHDFHNSWIIHLKEVLNEGLLPEGFYAQSEQHAGMMVGDILTLHEPEPSPAGVADRGAIAVADAPPRVRRKLVLPPEATYRRAKKSVAVRHTSGHRLVALLEIVSPSNRDRPKSVEEFTGKVVSALEAGVHVLIVDLIPPGRHDPAGLHGAVWSSYGDEEERIDPGAPLTLASYVAPGPRRLLEAYVEPVGVGATLPEMPLFLDPDSYINVPLEPTYEAAYRGVPGFWRGVIEGRREADRA